MTPVLGAYLHSVDGVGIARQHHVTVDDPDVGGVSVRWFGDREARWRCGIDGDQSEPDCAHTFAAALLLAEHVFGLTRVPELNPTPDNRKATTDA